MGLARDAGHPSCRTNACERIVVGPTAGDDLVDTLERLASTFAVPPVLFPCTDLSVLALSEGRARLAGAYRAVLPAPGVIELLLDKGSFHEYAERAGLPVARSLVLTERRDAEAAASLLAFPCALKPTIKTARWQAHTSAKVLMAASPEELLDWYDRARPWCDALVAQEWIEGTDEDQFTCNAYFDAASRPALTFVSQKLRQWPLVGGVGSLSQACRNDEVLRATIEVFQAVGHHGLAYLEMKRDRRTGRHVIIEPNVGRPTGRSAAADRAGIDLLYAQYRDALGLPLPEPAPQPERGAKWIYLRQDLQSSYRQVRDGSLSLTGWASSLRGCRHDAVWSWRDPRPFLADLRKAARKVRTRPAIVPSLGTVDYDIHGVVGLRLIDATPREAALVARQIGPATGALTREPDIVIRFVEHQPVAGVRWVEYGKTGFTDDGFYVLQSGKHPSRVRLSFEGDDGRCEMVCQRGVRKIPHLIGLVTLSALRRQHVPLHASAFRHRGVGVLVTGWAKGGKTEALLAFAANGAEYVGDEWILLAPGGRAMFGLPEHIRLQDWHLRQLPGAARLVPRARRLAFRTARVVDAAYGQLPSAVRELPGLGLIDGALPALRRQLNVQLDPLTVFGRGPSAFAGVPDKVFLMLSDEGRGVRVERADAGEVAARMAASVRYEQQPLQATYLASRFAFPHGGPDWLEEAGKLQAELIAEALRDKETYVVRHPYPVNLDELYRAMAPHCVRAASELNVGSGSGRDGQDGLEVATQRD